MATTKTTRKPAKVSKTDENGQEESSEEHHTDTEQITEQNTEQNTEQKTDPKDSPKLSSQKGADVARANGNGNTLDLTALKDMSISELTHIAKEMGVEGASGMRKAGIDFQSSRRADRKKRFDFLGRRSGNSARRLRLSACAGIQLSARTGRYLCFSPSQIRKFDLRTGDTISGQIRPPKEGERYFALIKVEAINFEAPEQSREKVFFDNLTPLYPDEQLRMEVTPDNISARVIDLVTPIGKGQRALIVAPPRTGKTMLLQTIANSITENHPGNDADRSAD